MIIQFRFTSSLLLSSAVCYPLTVSFAHYTSLSAPFCLERRHATSTWLDCSRLMSDFSGRSREFIKACFFHKTHRFLPLYVLGNRSKTLLLPIKICKRTDVPTASRLRSDGTSPKSHRLNFRILIRQAFLQIRILPFLLQ